MPDTDELPARPATLSPALYDALTDAVDVLTSFEYRADAIEPTSSVPGGTAFHKTIARLITRPISGVLQQTQEHARATSRAVALLFEAVTANRVGEQLDDLQTRVAEQRRELNALRVQLEQLAGGESPS